MMADLVAVHCWSTMMLAMVMDYHFVMMNQQHLGTWPSAVADAVMAETAAFRTNQSSNCSPHRIA